MKIKTTVSILFLLSAALTLSAQSSQPVKDRLASGDGPGGARIEVVEQGESGSIVKMLESSRKNTSVNGYRVRIFFDNSQDARTNASSTKSGFEQMFPNIPAYLNYENPYFKVSVGNCLTIDEAIILWGQVKGPFDKAFVIREEIQLSALTEDSGNKTAEEQ